MIVVIVDRVKMPENCEACPYVQTEDMYPYGGDELHCPLISRRLKGQEEGWKYRPKDCPMEEVIGVMRSARVPEVGGMNNFKNVIEKAQSLHGSIAQDVFPNGAVLRCSICGNESNITTNDCAYYLGHGWPKCCELAMTLEKKEVMDGA